MKIRRSLARKPFPISWPLPFALFYLPGLGQLRVTALNDKKCLGWAKITHPFHPYHGKKFEILKKRRVSGVDTLILKKIPRGTIAINKEWTNLADPSTQLSSSILRFECLLTLVDIIMDIKPKSKGSKL